MRARWIWSCSRCRTISKRYKRIISWSKAYPLNSTTSPNRCLTVQTFRCNKRAKNLWTTILRWRRLCTSKTSKSRPLTTLPWITTMLTTNTWVNSHRTSPRLSRSRMILQASTTPQLTTSRSSSWARSPARILASPSKCSSNSSSKCSTSQRILSLERTSIQIS